MGSAAASTAAVHGAGEPSSFYRPAQAYGLLAFMIAMTLCLELARLPLIVLVDPIRQTFGISDVQVSLLLGALSSVPFVLMSLVGGFLSDRTSRKLLLSAAVVLWVVGALVCATARDFGTLALGRVLIGAGAGMKLPIAMTWINDAFPPAKRGRAIGAFFVVLGTGPSLAIMLAGVVQGWAQAGTFAWSAAFPGGSEPWRSTMFLLALPSAAVLALLPFLHDRRSRDAAIEGLPADDGRFTQFGLMALVVGAAALVTLVDAGNLAWVSTILIRDYAFDTARAGVVFGVATLIAGLAGPLIGGALGDALFRRAGPRGRVALAGAAALAIAPLLAAYLLGSSTVLVIALTLSGICTVTALSLAYVAVQAVLPQRARGLGTGVMSATTNLLGSTGPTLVALASEGAGLGGLTVALTVVAGIASVMAAALFFTCAIRLGPAAGRPAGAPVRT